MAITVDHHLGAALAMRRRVLLRSQESVAEQLNVSVQTVRNWEAGRLGTLGSIRAHCRALGLHLYEAEAIANNGPVAGFSQAARALSATYWEKN